MTSNGDPTNCLDPSSIPSRHDGGSTSSTSASTIRPRNRRLVSFVEDSSGEDGEVARLRGSQDRNASSSGLSAASSTRLRTSPSPSTSRDASPIPRKHPSRPTTTTRTTSSSSYRDSPSPKRSKPPPAWDSQGKKPVASGFSTDFWSSSWSSLQSLASSVMGSGTSGAENSGFSWINGQPNRNPPAVGSLRGGPGARSKPSLTSAWGPSNLAWKEMAPGSKEERDALVQAKKREALLLANGDTMTDSQGNYKRRDSSEGAQSFTQTSEDHDSETLVYIHQVQPNDSLTSVSIRYGCQPGVLRKANGFWPNDSIQVRSTVVIPVNACTIKGRPIRHEETVHYDVGDLLQEDTNPDTSSLNPSDQPTNLADAGEYFPTLRQESTTSSISGRRTGKAPSWKHEYWVQVDGFPEPLELGRVPRGTLGFFPRARRKSQTQFKPYSDNDDTPSLPPSNTQYSIPRTSASPDRQKRPSIVSSSRTSPGPSSFRDRSTSNNKNMSSKGPSRHRRHRSSFFLSGTGGVGTLDHSAIEPGPGPDRLNNFVTSHIPNLAIQPPPLEPHGSTTESGRRPPRLSFDSSSSVTSNSSTTGLENVGGAIEGWFRKVATRAKTGLNDQQPSSQLRNDLGIRGNGDLIELGDTRESSRTATPSPAPGRSREQRRLGSTLRASSSTPGAPGSLDNIARGRQSNTSEMSRTKHD